MPPQFMNASSEEREHSNRFPNSTSHFKQNTPPDFCSSLLYQLTDGNFDHQIYVWEHPLYTLTGGKNVRFQRRNTKSAIQVLTSHGTARPLTLEIPPDSLRLSKAYRDRFLLPILWRFPSFGFAISYSFFFPRDIVASGDTPADCWNIFLRSFVRMTSQKIT